MNRMSGIGMAAGCLALAGCGDGDNNHVLCLDIADQALSVSFPGGILKDPNGDLNPPTTIAVGG